MQKKTRSAPYGSGPCSPESCLFKPLYLHCFLSPSLYRLDWKGISVTHAHINYLIYLNNMFDRDSRSRHSFRYQPRPGVHRKASDACRKPDPQNTISAKVALTLWSPHRRNPVLIPVTPPLDPRLLHLIRLLAETAAEEDLSNTTEE